MAKVKFVPKSSGLVELMNSGGVQSVCEQKATAVKNSANEMLSPEGYAIDSFEQSTRAGRDGRAIHNVYTRTRHAQYSQNKNKTLTKAFGSAGGS